MAPKTALDFIKDREKEQQNELKEAERFRHMIIGKAYMKYVETNPSYVDAFTAVLEQHITALLERKALGLKALKKEKKLRETA
ncbi:MAG: hypothetical protein K0U54_11810 [Bacteroidetes bacterium]|nr:hypothetical protein [Bacteroidota bacterium]